MSLSMTDIKNITHLARLHSSEEETETLKNQLNKILEFIDKMSEINTDKVTALAHPGDQATQPLREDKVTEIDQRQLFQTNAPATAAGLYLVPQVIDTPEE